MYFGFDYYRLFIVKGVDPFLSLVLKTKMQEISKEQESIKEGQRQVREKFEMIEEECEQLRNGTSEMVKQSAITQIRLALMFTDPNYIYSQIK
ncbi:hypothetical protein CRYUN_Cryun39dG0073800 [Craigia yunnanensis]